MQAIYTSGYLKHLSIDSYRTHNEARTHRTHTNTNEKATFFPSWQRDTLQSQPDDVMLHPDHYYRYLLHNETYQIQLGKHWMFTLIVFAIPVHVFNKSWDIFCSTNVFSSPSYIASIFWCLKQLYLGFLRFFYFM